MLTGQRVWVTRPANQAQTLIEGLRSAGALPVSLPLLEIAPPVDLAPLDAALAELPQTDLVIFVSPSAMDAVMARWHQPWPAKVPVAVVGPGSERRALEYGMADVIAPARQFDSEGLLAEPRLHTLAGRKVLLFRGDGGRDILPAGLRERGAQLTLVSAYRRLPPAFDNARLGAELDAGCDAAVVSSSEAAHYLFTQFEASYRKRLQSVLYFTPHPRIAAALAEHGATRIVATEAGDAGIVTSLCRYFNRTP
ncbi:uroporphyrinogen-III synthase [Silvimonas terrae]|uniref:Uroporphyrinogen-III synthase n=1 Tax=Silvimonas terrae TaxID=300266 RepID=A0A840RI27_9NEIS|nr:uroporphyrinogen-III synthase [Silvimonas terrae]MBB5191912.1 uroporphyrinogen-III synthase [Silvimonas terrae]